MSETQALLSELARMTAMFQMRAVCFQMGFEPPEIGPGEPIRALVKTQPPINSTGSK